MSLKDFETKEIITNPIFNSSHGGSFATPNTEYIIEGAQYPAPIDRKYHPLNQDTFNKFWRGGITFHKFNNASGKVQRSESFTVVAPPYSQDLSDAGKGESYGYSFTNSFCAERYYADSNKGTPPYEAGCSARDTDYLHIVNWKRAEEVVKAGKTQQVNGHTVIPLDVAAKEGVLFLIPEPKSPHGSDVSPDGRFIIVAGKLDTHASVYDFRKIKDLIAKQEFTGKDDYGIPILDMQKSLHGQVEIGLGPLHTQFDAKEGIAYTSVYIDSVVVKWDFLNLKVLDKVSVHYNIGHLVSMEGDAVNPKGRYVISLNKLAIDRFTPVGPLHPQNHQLIDTSGEKMRLIYDLPLPMGEPHYTVCIDANTIKPMDVYPIGTDSVTMAPSNYATKPGKERIERKGKSVHVFATLGEAGLTPLELDVKQGDDVFYHLTNTLQIPDSIYKFNVSGYDALGIVAPGRVATVRFVASQAGLFSIDARLVDEPIDGRTFGYVTVQPNAAYNQKRLAAHQVQLRRRERLMAPLKTAQKIVNLAPGQAEFETYSCGGCHVKGRESGGPDLTDVTVRQKKDWLVKWINNPEQYYGDPAIVPMIARFGVKMPNQGVSIADAEKIVTYLETWRSQPSGQETSNGTIPSAYSKICFACHDQGVAGAPKIGSKSDWETRIAQGTDTLYQHAINGYQGKLGFMPPRGGCADCSDPDIKAAVDYLTSKSR